MWMLCELLAAEVSMAKTFSAENLKQTLAGRREVAERKHI